MIFKALVFLIGFTALLLSCGTEKQADPEPLPPSNIPPVGGEDPGPGIGDISYPEMQALLITYCNQCHASAQFMQSEQALRGSRTEDEIVSRSMPPRNAAKQLPDAERSLMISFF